MPPKLTRLSADIGARLKALREELGYNQAEFADKLGVARSSISRMEQGERPPSAELLFGLVCDLDIDLKELLCGVAASHPFLADAVEIAANVRPVIRPLSDNLHDLPPERVADEYVAVPLVDGQVAAGPGRVAWESVRSLVWVFKPELGRRKNLVALRVAGDSMTPTIPDQAIIIVDRDSRQPSGNRKGIWALRTEDGDVQIKRLYRRMPSPADKLPETWWILSENLEDYPPELAWTMDFDRLVLGQVVWMWRSLV